MGVTCAIRLCFSLERGFRCSALPNTSLAVGVRPVELVPGRSPHCFYARISIQIFTFFPGCAITARGASAPACLRRRPSAPTFTLFQAALSQFEGSLLLC